jgi:hypothetical protein
MISKTLRLLLIPLDERPVNTKYPQAIAAMAGAELLLPPLPIRGWKRTPANLDQLVAWIISVSKTCDAALISCDYLGYGNLINARISGSTAAEVITRLGVLAELSIPVHAFSLITRVSNADDNIEEPLYWNDWGTKIYRYAALQHRQLAGDDLSGDECAELAGLTATLPRSEMADWLVRRLRNHTVNLMLLDLAARHKIATLLLTSDDTAAWGFPTRERQWLKSWTALIPNLDSNVEMHPGADEVGSAIVSRMINVSHGARPTVWIDYAIEADQSLIAPYEDRPICETVLGQIRACGGKPAQDSDSADLFLGVLTPSPNRKDYQQAFLETDRTTRTAPYMALFKRLADFQVAGKPTILADVAYPNGADPLAMEIVFSKDSPLRLGELVAYGAWNTAGNTLGVAIAQGMASQYAKSEPDRVLAQSKFLAHRFLEDWAYQTVVRREARQFAIEHWNRPEPDPKNESELLAICECIERQLSEHLTVLRSFGVGVGLSLVPSSTTLPWHRTFEVDFDLGRSPLP